MSLYITKRKRIQELDNRKKKYFKADEIIRKIKKLEKTLAFEEAEITTAQLLYGWEKISLGICSICFDGSVEFGRYINNHQIWIGDNHSLKKLCSRCCIKNEKVFDKEKKIDCIRLPNELDYILELKQWVENILEDGNFGHIFDHFINVRRKEISKGQNGYTDKYILKAILNL